MTAAVSTHAAIEEAVAKVQAPVSGGGGETAGKSTLGLGKVSGLRGDKQDRKCLT